MVGEAIAQARKKKKISQKELAALVKVTPSAVCQWETGKTIPDIVNLSEIAAVLNVSVSFLLGEETTKQDSDPSAEKIIEIFSNLSDENKKAAIQYIDYLSGKKD